MKKKVLLSSILFAVFFMLLMPGAARAAVVDSGECGAKGGNVTWTLTDDGTVTIQGTGEMQYYGNSNYSSSPWENNTKIKKIVIKKGVTNIGAWAFHCCENLTSVTIPDGVKTIGNNAFYECKKLTSLQIPNGVTAIETGAFGGCTNLSSVSIPSTVTNFGGTPFGSTPWLRSLGDFAVVNNVLLCYQGKDKNVIIPNGINVIGASSFWTTTIESVTISDSVTSIGDRAFADCDNLTSISFAKSVTNIGDWVFESCGSLKEIVLPYGVTTLGKNTFSSSSVRTIAIPKSVTGIETDAFRQCRSLKDIYYEGTKDEWNQIIYEEILHVSNEGNWTERSYGGGLVVSSEATIHYNSTGFQNGSSNDESQKESTIPDASSVKTTAYLQNDAGKGTIKLSYDERDLALTSTTYRHPLGCFTAALSALAYNNDKHHDNVKNALKGLGFVNIGDVPTNKDYTGSPFYIAHKKVKLNGKNTEILLITIRGTYLKEWLNDFESGYKSNVHEGFQSAADYVYSNTLEYVNNSLKYADNNEDGFDKSLPAKIIITGHSRGAAASNLLGYKLDKDGLKGVKAGKEDIFVYTYATPNTSKSSDVTSKKYNNIFNIVNPEDFVTKVLFPQWGFKRYGTTYVLPSKTTDTSTFGNHVNYSKYLEKLKASYKKYRPADPKEYKPYRTGMLRLALYIQHINSIVHSTKDYYTLVLFTSDTKYLPIFLKSYAGNIGSLKYLYQSALGGMCSGDSSLKEQASIVIAEAVLGSFGALGQSTVEYFIENHIVSRDFDCAHQSETYLAAMMNLTMAELTADRRTLLGIANCPVDITIKDDNGKTVGEIKNNKITRSRDELALEVNGDSKSFAIPSDSKYTIVITGNDEGTMDYSLREMDPDTGEVKRVYYKDVPISKKTKLTQVVKKEAEPKDAVLKDSSGKTISGKNLKSSDLGALSVNVKVEGKGLAEGRKNLSPCDYVELQAYPNEGYSFDGWYDADGNLLSSKKEYGFSIQANTKLTAKFKKTELIKYEDTKTATIYLLNEDMKIATLSKSKTKKKSFTIPATIKVDGKTYKVTAIAANAFKKNKKLKKVTIGKNIEKIGKSAFQSCKKLKTIKIKTNKLTAKTVGAKAFKGTARKAKVRVPKKKRKAYKKLLRKKGLSKKAKVK